MALQPQIVMGNGSFTVRRYLEIDAATTTFRIRVAKTAAAPLPPAAEFDPRFGSQVNLSFYEKVATIVMFFGNINYESQLNGAFVPALFLSFFNQAGNFFLNMFGLRSPPFRTFDPFFPSPSGPIAWDSLEFETVPAGQEPRYFDVVLTREPSASNISVTIDLVLPHTVIQ